MKISNRSLWFIFVVAVGSVVGSLLFLFRTSHHDTPQLGHVVFRYRWGRPSEMVVDQNRDGKTDGRYIVDGTFDNVPPLESWIDSEFTGRFDVHVVNKKGSPHVVEVDRNGDGVFECSLSGEAAQQFLYELGRNRAALSRTIESAGEEKARE